MTKREQAIDRALAYYGAPRPLVRSFVPKGRSRYMLYAVSLKEHPGVTKVGRTKNWNSRRRSYEGWNLSSDAIAAERVFTITDEYIDLPVLERELLADLPFPRRHGEEWFVADIDEVARAIDRFLCAHGLSYV